ncbi:MAG TPA: DUF190 domain-containing protein [Thermoanaerobaculia bacterium]|jgi:CBS-domain-containing membrane protein/PII-like signaling protein|nr:DUF190 domain-containing protein [Thermoanaerobaculia bacterium]
MRILGPAKRLTVYFGESDRWRGLPLHGALLETLRKDGFAGATVMRGVAGFGAHSRIHSTAILRLSEDLPLVLVLVDTAERVDHAVALIGPMVREGLITVEDVTIVKYSHRYLAPLPADRPVRELMSEPAVATTPGAAILEAWDLMLHHGLKALPVIGDGRRPVGMLSDGDLMEKTGLVQRLAVAERLDAATLAAWRQALAGLTAKVGEVMTQPAETIVDDSSLGRAAALMSEHGRKRLPVVDRGGALVGMLSRFDVLAAVSPAHKGQREQPPPGASRTVGEVMDRHLPAVPEDADLPEVVGQMVAGGHKRLIVVDGEGRPLGLISDGDLVARVRPDARSGLLRALARRGRAPDDSTATARELMSPGMLEVAPGMPVGEAIQRALANRRKRLVVVDEQGRAIGIVDRRDLLRAIAG